MGRVIAIAFAKEGGAGIPLAFFLFHLMAQVSDSLEDIKYISLNTPFETAAILNGDGYIILAMIGFILYAIGIRVFQQQDLPL
ncbi:hypothetical protein FQ087_09240 [Sporosarcina sp. ANT_H38]|uniref:hypothetical protein n=1 Tax=Sporosarcina sp. ANT_H38 TaxID=2597358 RepID=UPI0011F1619D|nr:hypothetical protein [Sporosarcina sp. ANT_H38]KAA0966395.1 hypothetical protein FQ087_09240 [Sporosarcina sp. ANT_H38]